MMFIYKQEIKVWVWLIVVAGCLQQQAIGQQPPKMRLQLSDSAGIDCILIRPGNFLMGSPASDTLAHDIERPQHQVQIEHAFYLAVTPVTIRQFTVFVEETGYKTVAETDRVGGHGYSEAKKKFEGLFPAYTWRHTGWEQTNEHPVVNVSWVDATRFCEWLSAKTGKRVGLPTEEEWEYACRAGTTTIFFTGNDPNSLEKYANVSDDALRDKLQETKTANRTFSFNDRFPFTAPVASFKPNPWRLYDMIGNVWQICNGGLTWNNTDTTQKLVAKGGSYNSYPEFARCAVRGRIKATSKYGYIGFRIRIYP